MRILSILLASAAMTAASFAQESEPAGSDEGLSELERLSRSADDPFAGVIETEMREPISVTIRALDKITARYTDLDIGMNQIAHFGSLEIQPRTCDKRPPEEFPETTAFLEIFDTEFGNRQSDLKIELPPEVIEDDIEEEAEEFDVLPVKPMAELQEDGEQEEKPVGELPPLRDPLYGDRPAPEVLNGPQAEGVNIFRGWMFASTPALNSLEHPVYDVWVIDCKTRVVEN